MNTYVLGGIGLAVVVIVVVVVVATHKKGNNNNTGGGGGNKGWNCAADGTCAQNCNQVKLKSAANNCYSTQELCQAACQKPPNPTLGWQCNSSGNCTNDCQITSVKENFKADPKCYASNATCLQNCILTAQFTPSGPNWVGVNTSNTTNTLISNFLFSKYPNGTVEIVSQGPNVMSSSGDVEFYMLDLQDGTWTSMDGSPLQEIPQWVIPNTSLSQQSGGWQPNFGNPNNMMNTYANFPIVVLENDKYYVNAGIAVSPNPQCGQGSSIPKCNSPTSSGCCAQYFLFITGNCAPGPNGDCIPFSSRYFTAGGGTTYFFPAFVGKYLSTLNP